MTETANLCHLKTKCIISLSYLQWFAPSCSFFHPLHRSSAAFPGRIPRNHLGFHPFALPSFFTGYLVYMFKEIFCVKACVSDGCPLYSFFFMPFFFFIRELQFLAGRITAIIKNIFFYISVPKTQQVSLLKSLIFCSLYIALHLLLLIFFMSTLSKENLPENSL